MKILKQDKSDSPIFDGVKYKNLIFLTGGGGGKKYGLPNTIQALNGQNFEQSFQLQTQELYEKLYVSEFNDYLLANSENQITVFKINEKNLEQKDSIEIKIENNEQIICHLFENNFYVSNSHNKFMIFEIKNFSFQKIFDIDVEKPIINFCGLNDKEILVVYKDEILLFSIPNKKFIETIVELKNSKKKLISRFSENTFYLLESNLEKSILTIYSNNNSKNFRKVCSLNIKSLIIKMQLTDDGLIILSNIQGELIFIYEQFSLDSINEIKRVQLNDFPITTMISRKIPTTEGDIKQLNLLTYSQDYKTYNLLINPEKMNSQYQMKYIKQQITIVVLLIAILIGIIKFTSNQQ